MYIQDKVNTQDNCIQKIHQSNHKQSAQKTPINLQTYNSINLCIQ
jgi:hypothetical protein